MKKFWNWIKNSDDTRILRLEGPIDEESFWGDEITPQMFRDAYDHFAEGESPDPPFICFLYPKAENFGADNLVYHHFNRLDIEVYTDYKDPDMEASIEEVLTAHELYYEKSEVWIETEKMYEVLYELTV